MAKTKIVLDADVIIHFIKGECFSSLFDILPAYGYIILDKVYDELKRHHTLIDNYIRTFKKVCIENYNPTGKSIAEYFRLTKDKGKGESACMVYCKENNDVLGSSNLADIHAYCASNGITYLTTLDFLYYAYKNKVMTEKECNEFIAKVKQSDSKLPLEITDIMLYKCTVMV